MESVNTTEISASATLERLFPAMAEASRLTIACRQSDYSAGAIARAVEDCDAHLLNLNVTSDRSADPLDSTVVVEIRVSHRDPMAVTRSLERYGFRVLDYRGAGDALPSDENMRDRFDELIHYLEV